MKRISVSIRFLVTHLLLVPVVGAHAAGNERIEQRQTKRYQTKEFTFECPAAFKASVDHRGATIRIIPRSRSPYWEDSIIIHKLEKNAECDIPQDSQPDTDDKRKIAGHPAYAYSGED